MRKILLFSSIGAAIACCFYFIAPTKKSIPDDKAVIRNIAEDDEEHDGYDEAAARDQFEFDRMKDPALGYIPMDRMMKAVDYSQLSKQTQKANGRTASTLSNLTWTERGPIYDLVGASGNSRGPGTNYTAGRIAAVLIDTLNDPTGNTVFCGGIAGGVWKCTNFLSAIPNWQKNNDRFDNLAISSICQDPTTPSTMYFSTGEATSNIDAVYGAGIWKSTNSGATWVKLENSTGFLRVFKIVCDGAGNLYIANRNQNPPAAVSSGIYRSKDGGNSFQNITPAALTSTNNIATDIEYSTTGKLHVSFGYLGTKVQHVFSADPANVTTTIGVNPTDWKASTGIRLSATSALRLELATLADTLYGVTVNSSYQLDSCYKSIDGGATWTKQNTTAFPTGILNGQGWYNLTLAINPSNSTEFLVGGLDAYKSVNSGVTIPTRMTYWVSTAPYVHADHHFMQWWNAGSESRIVIGSDGGLFYSNNAAASFTDKNRNLSIKQFYAAAIHPTAGSPYLLAGAQDNGVHALTNAGLSFSTEVYGGDGCFVHINQQNPQIQFGSYVYNTYRRSTDGGATWSSLTLNSNGLFVNPFDYDDGQNIMYASNGVQGTPNNQILRWSDANTSATTTVLTLSALNRGGASNATTFKVSPFSLNTVYIGGSSGKLLRLNNAKTVTSATVDANITDITGASFPNANLSCINIGSSENYLVAVFSNYGVGHVFYSTNGGTSWTLIDGNLPDMPVRWALFDPQDNSKLLLATEAGVYSTDAVNGTGTVWNADTNFPTVRTDMLQLRLSDNTIVAATHGRGLFTAVLPALPEIRFTSPVQMIAEASTGTIGCRGYKDYLINVADIAAPTGDATVTYSVAGGSTATEGIDFDFTTNGSFTTPSKQQTFSSGAVTTKNITIRVYDDDAVESDETFTITFAVSGATDAFAGSFNTYTVVVKDNDVLPSTSIAPATYAVGTYTVNVSGATALRSNFQKHRVQVLYRASELTALGAGKGPITSITTRVVTKNSTKPYNGYTISMSNTSSTNLYNDFESGLTQVYTANYTSVLGDNTFPFGTGTGSASSFVWDGRSNIVIQFCFDNAPASADVSADVVEGSNPFGTGSAADNYPSIYSNFTATGGSSGCGLDAYNISNSRINAKFLLSVTGNPVETVLNASKTSYLSPNDDVYFYNSNGNIIGRIKNLSGSDYACTQMTVDRAGAGALPFWNNNAANYITTKSLQVVPTTNNPSGQYQITLYYTAAEKAAWEATTGQNWNTIQIVKVKSQIKNYSPSTPFPDGPGAVETVTPTFGTFGADYTLTATFSSGFSGFAAGNIGFPLPVTLLDFTGRLDNNTIALNWSTSTEQNSKNFDVEKSTDGVNFYNIGSVNAAGNSSTRKDYSLRDDKLSSSNYYRLRMNDRDGHNKLSNVVLIKYDVKAQNVWVIKNPFSSFIDVRLAKDAAQVKLQLVDVKGAVVAEKTVAKPSGLIHWEMKTNISNGSYILRTIVDGNLFSNKLIKQ